MSNGVGTGGLHPLLVLLGPLTTIGTSVFLHLLLLLLLEVVELLEVGVFLLEVEVQSGKLL